MVTRSSSIEANKRMRWQPPLCDYTFLTASGKNDNKKMKKQKYEIQMDEDEKKVEISKKKNVKYRRKEFRRH